MKVIGKASPAIRLMLGTSLAAMAFPAMAQSADDDAGGLDEIVVTAQKREQNLQETPLAISAVSGETLELRGISEAKDLAAIAPNVSALGGTTSGAAAVITIRGIATAADETQGFDSPIGMYLDGVYLARSAASTFEVADIERVEVLRGPQGTLFGRNTTGGAVNFITKQPSLESGGSLKLGFGNYGQILGKGSIDTGDIGGGLRMTFSGLYKSRNGVVNNRLEPRKSRDPGSYKTSGGRWAVVFEPSDNLKISNSFDYTWSNGNPLPMQLAAVGSGVPFNPTASTIAFAAANGFNIVSPAPIAQYLAQGSTTILESGCTKQVSTSRSDPICLNNDKTSRDILYGDLFRVELDLDGVSIRSSTAFRKWKSKQRGGDLDGMGTLNGAALGAPATTLNGFPASVLGLIMPAGNAAFLASQPVNRANLSLFDATNLRDQKQFSQEIEIISDNDGPLNWVLGGFYFKESGNELNQQSFGFILDTNVAVFTPTSFGPLAPLLQANNPARYRAALQASTLAYHAKGNSKAVYGQAEYRPEGKDGALGVTLGLRYTWDSKGMRVIQNGAAAYTGAAAALNDQNAKFSDWTGNLTVDYRMDNGVNLYARVARGYRSGGFNARQPTNVAAGLGLLPFDNEVIWSYEAGFKADIGNTLRLNGSVFLNDYSDLQLAVPIPITGGGSFGTKVDNAGKVRYTGFELEATFKPTDTFWIDGNLGYTKKKFREYLTLNAANQARDISAIVSPGYAPDWTANLAGNVRVPLGEASATLRVGWSYISDYFQFGNPLTAPFYRETKGDSRGLIDAQLQIAGVNLGGTAVEFVLWGKNIGDKEYVMRSVDFGQLGFGTTIYGDPATFGMSVGVKF